MIRIAFAGLALALFSACVTSSKGDDDPGSAGSNAGGAPGSNSGGGSIGPRSGAWVYGELTPVSSTCNANTQHGEAGGFAIDQVLASSFRIIPGDGTAPFTCTSTGARFRCPDRASFAMDYRPSVDAQITVHATATGAFSDAAHATGTQQATVECTGAQCAVIGPLPCAFTVDYAIHAQ